MSKKNVTFNFADWELLLDAKTLMMITETAKTEAIRNNRMCVDLLMMVLRAAES